MLVCFILQNQFGIITVLKHPAVTKYNHPAAQINYLSSGQSHIMMLPSPCLTAIKAIPWLLQIFFLSLWLSLFFRSHLVLFRCNWQVGSCQFQLGLKVSVLGLGLSVTPNTFPPFVDLQLFFLDLHKVPCFFSYCYKCKLIHWILSNKEP